MSKQDCFIFDENKLDIVNKPEWPDLQFMEVLDPKNDSQHVIIDLAEAIKREFKDELLPDFDFLHQFKKSSPPYLVEYSRKHGRMFYAYGNLLFVFESQNLYYLLNHKDVEVRKSMVAYQDFKKTISQIIVVEDQVIVEAKQEIQILPINNLKRPLDVIDGSKFTDGQWIRQISHNGKPFGQLKLLITTSDQKLFEYTKNGGLAVCPSLLVRSAIYNQTGEEIIAIMNDDDLNKPGAQHISILESGGNPTLNRQLNTIKFDFADEMPDKDRNYFRTYYITEYRNGTCFIIAAFFLTDEDKEPNDLIGSTIVFMVNADLNKDTKWSQLKAQKNAFKYFYLFDKEHMYDLDDNGNQPIIKTIQLDCYSQEVAKQLRTDDQTNTDIVCCLQINHVNEPVILIKHADGQFTATSYQNLRQCPQIQRPMDDNGDQILDDEECLGCTLGLFFVDSLLCMDQKDKRERTIFGETQSINSPPLLAIYGLDGKLYVWEVLLNKSKDRRLGFENHALPEPVQMDKVDDRDDDQIVEKPVKKSVEPFKSDLVNFEKKKVADVDKVDDFDKFAEIDKVDENDKIDKKEQPANNEELEKNGEQVREFLGILKDQLDSRDDEIIKADAELRQEFYKHINFLNEHYEQLDPAMQQNVDQAFQEFKKRFKNLQQTTEELQELYEQPKREELAYLSVQEKQWRQQYQAKITSFNPQDDDLYIKESIDDIKDNKENESATFLLYVMNIDENLTQMYNQTIVQKLNDNLNRIIVGIQNLPQCNPHEIDKNDHELPKLVINEKQKVRQTQRYVQNLRQSVEIMKRELAKGLPGRSNLAVNQSIDLVHNEFDYLQLLIARVAQQRSMDSKHNIIPVLRKEEVLFLQKVVQNAKNYDNKLRKNYHKIDRSHQIPLVISKELAKHSKITQLEIQEMNTVVSEFLLQKNISMAAKKPIANQNQGINFSQNKMNNQFGRDQVPQYQIGQEKHKIILNVAKQVSDLNIRIQGRFVNELLNRIYSKIDNLKQVMNIKSQEPMHQELDETSTTSSTKVYKNRYGVPLSDDAMPTLSEPQQFQSLIKKSANTKEERLAKKKRMIEKLKYTGTGASFQTDSQQFVFDRRGREEELKAYEEQVKSEIESFKNSIKENTFEAFKKEREEVAAQIKAKTSAKDVNVPQPEIIQMGNLSGAPNSNQQPASQQDMMQHLQLQQQNHKLQREKQLKELEIRNMQLRQAALEKEQAQLQKQEKFQMFQQVSKPVQPPIQMAKDFKEEPKVPQKKSQNQPQNPMMMQSSSKKALNPMMMKQSSNNLKSSVEKLQLPKVEESIQKDPKLAMKTKKPSVLDGDLASLTSIAVKNFQSSRGDINEPKKDMRQFENNLKNLLDDSEDSVSDQPNLGNKTESMRQPQIQQQKAAQNFASQEFALNKSAEVKQKSQLPKQAETPQNLTNFSKKPQDEPNKQQANIFSQLGGMSLQDNQKNFGQLDLNKIKAPTAQESNQGQPVFGSSITKPPNTQGGGSASGQPTFGSTFASFTNQNASQNAQQPAAASQSQAQPPSMGGQQPQQPAPSGGGFFSGGNKATFGSQFGNSGSANQGTFGAAFQNSGQNSQPAGGGFNFGNAVNPAGGQNNSGGGFFSTSFQFGASQNQIGNNNPATSAGVSNFASDSNDPFSQGQGQNQGFGGAGQGFGQQFQVAQSSGQFSGAAFAKPRK